MEITAYKNTLLQNIAQSFNSATSLQRLALACDFIKSEENCGQLPNMPIELLNQFYIQGRMEYALGLCLSDKDLDKEIEQWQ